jgi:hypothetical protein
VRTFHIVASAQPWELLVAEPARLGQRISSQAEDNNLHQEEYLGSVFRRSDHLGAECDVFNTIGVFERLIGVLNVPGLRSKSEISHEDLFMKIIDS